MDHREDIELRVRLQKELVKGALKEAMKEWLDEKILTFGKWSLIGIASAFLVLIAYGFLLTHGWSLEK